MPLGNSTYLQIPLMAEADNQKYLLHNDSVQALDFAFNRLVAVDTSGGDVTLTEGQITRNVFFDVSGHATPVSLFVPTTVGTTPAVPVNRQIYVRNNGTDDLTISHTGSPGNTTVVSPADIVLVHMNGTDVTGLIGNTETAASIKTKYEINADTNVFTDAEKTKLASVESGATGDMTAGEIKTSYESNSDTNAFTDAEKTKLANIENNATASGVSVLQETLIGGNVVNSNLSDPPVSPSNGDAYIVGETPTGDWAGEENSLAIYETNSWVFYVPEEGWTLYDQANDTNLQWTGTAWTIFTSGAASSGNSGGAGLELIGSYDLSTNTLNSGNEIYIDVSGYTNVRIVTTDAANAASDPVEVTFSTDNISYRTGASDYKQNWFTSTTELNNNLQNNLLIAGGGGATNIAGVVNINNLNTTDINVTVEGWSSSSADSFSVFGIATNVESISYIRIQAETAYTSGNIQVYGTRLSQRTAAPGLIPKVKNELLSLSGTSTTWNIPPNCLWVNIISSDLVGDSVNQVFTVKLIKQSDGLPATVDYVLSELGSTTTSLTSSGSSDFIAQARSWDSVQNGLFAIQNIRILDPSDSAVKTFVSSDLLSRGDQLTNSEFSKISGSTTAQTYSAVEFSVDSGSVAGECMIQYAVLEAENGYDKALISSDTVLNLGNVPASLTLDPSANSINVTLPVNAPVGTIVKGITVAVGNTVTVTAAGLERINGLTSGVFTANGVNPYEEFSFERIEYSSGNLEWAARGDGVVS